MAPFPVSSSIVATAALGPFLVKQYGLTTTATCQLLKAGISHTYLLVDGETRYIFRLYTLDWRSQTEILEEVRLLQLLQENGIPVSYALPDQSGAYIQDVPAPEGLRYGVLFSHAAGEKLFTFSPEMHTHIGEVMGRMHQLTHNLLLERETYTPSRLLVDSFIYLRQRLPADSDEMHFMQRAQVYLLTNFGRPTRLSSDREWCIWTSGSTTCILTKITVLRCLTSIFAATVGSASTLLITFSRFTAPKKTSRNVIGK
jgi:Ser/Thr protein kinase RdoA (MazF antagonist)